MVKAAKVGTQSSSSVAKPGERLVVFSIKPSAEGGSVWVRAGSAWVNRDGSLNVYLDVLPLDGKLHLRRAIPEVAGATDTVELPSGG